MLRFSGAGLAEEIVKTKFRLKHQETITTNLNGEKYIERISQNGETTRVDLNKPGYGFIVDYVPDLDVAEILPYLLLSSQDVVLHSQILKENEVTHVLSIGVEVHPDYRLQEILYKKVDLLDLPNASLLNVLNECLDYIESVVRESDKNKILIHCNAGYSRSPSIVIAYLMKFSSCDMEEAFQIVRRKRNVRPNDGFLKQLKLFETLLRS